MHIEQFVMAYEVEQDRLSVLPALAYGTFRLCPESSMKKVPRI